MKALKYVITLIIMLAAASFLTVFSAAAEIGQTENGLRVEYLFADDEHTEPVCDENGVQYLKVTGYIGKSGKVDIPKSVDMSGDGTEHIIYAIAEGAFAQIHNVSRVIIPDSVKVIGKGAFSGCRSLTSVVIPESITEIPDECFSDCVLLSSVTLTESIVRIGHSAFDGCLRLRELKIPSSVNEIGRYAFNACENLVLDTSENEYALKYAAENNLFTDFESSPDSLLTKVVVISLLLGAAVIAAEISFRHMRQRKKTGQS